MKKTRKIFSQALALAAAVVLVAPALTAAQEAGGDPPDLELRGPGGFGGRGPGWHRGPRGRGPGGPGRGMMLRQALAGLDLSEGQRQEIKAVFEADREQMRGNHEQVRQLGSELEALIETGPFDESAVRAKASELAALRVEMAVVRARHASEIRSVLTSEQLELLDERRERRKQFRDERRERFESFRERRQQR